MVEWTRMPASASCEGAAEEPELKPESEMEPECEKTETDLEPEQGAPFLETPSPQ